MSDEQKARPGLRSGFVTILGRPNVGKSTLLNALVGFKIAIVSNKPQTTRTALSGVATIDARHPLAARLLERTQREGKPAPPKEPMAQIIFLDTPGIHEPMTRLDRRMMDEVRQALAERDLLFFVADASKPFQRRDEESLQWVRRAKTPAFLLLNKMDAVAKPALLPLMERYGRLHEWVEVVPISARTGQNLDLLVDLTVARLPEGPLYFPPDQLTEQPLRFLAAEIIREKIIQLTRQELPYASAVQIREYSEQPKLTRIGAEIFVEREGQKAILIGARGQMLKRIGTEARRDIEKLVGQQVFLQLFVRVREQWREDPRFLEQLDWRHWTGGE